MDPSRSYAEAREADDSQIRTAACPRCILCGHEGDSIYLGQRDRLFGTAGLWNLKICSNRECGLIWLDPMPIREDIGKAYANYYTHKASDSTRHAGLLKRIRALAQHGYWANKYNYETGPQPLLARTLGRLLSLSPIHRREADAWVRCLPAVPQGRLLDVGCGSGEWLLTMRQRGWLVEGFDFDESAVKLARQNGLKAECGSLEQQGYPDDSFDAVTLNHVVEHVPDPVRTLAECRRILKPNGRLVLFTPNSASWGHRLFKECWRGLEPPRHLHIFSMKSMHRALVLAGFQQVTLLPFIVTSVIYESLLLRWGRTNFTGGTSRHWPAWGITRLFKIWELCLLPWNRSLGDCVIAIAVKSARPL
ncbi:MAG TPA: methyltransferase domain-containing protein [Verrucomicrobiae bacterium]|nr:methyltransferase domain-containing protein [Verrucomicrobiae bacterium]